jgi:CubicO group peptidase (beta-lactamase class C family)
MVGRGSLVGTRGWFVALAVILVWSMLGAPVRAQSVDVDTLDATLDRAMADHMAAYDIPGAVVVVVADGRVVAARGYGFADPASSVAVDPARTRFDIGSVTKLFTATAVMQQVERGAVDLDADVNAYLAGVEIPATYPQPVTTAHLLTHTAGFDERHWVGWFTLDLDEVEPLADNLARNLPPRIRPPGQRHQYNNHGMALAGHVVESVTDTPFDTYVTDHLLEPLGMTSTTFGEPPANEAFDAVGHQSMGGTVQPVPPWYLHLRPAGGLWSTGEDMAAFMLAHLGHAGADTGFPSPTTLAVMQHEQFASHPAVPGIGYGFFQAGDQDRHAIQHGGGWVGFGSALYLLPGHDLGVFVAFNHGSGALAAGPAIEEIVTGLLGPAPAHAMADAPGATDAAQVEGAYRWIRHDHHSFMRLVSLLSAPVMRVVAEDDRTIATSMAPRLVDDGRWVATDEPGVFVEVDGARTLAFDLDGEQASMLHIAGVQLFPMERVGWRQTPTAIGALLGVLVLAMLVAALGWPLGALRERRRRRRGKNAPAVARRTRRLAGGIGLLGLVFLFGLAAQFAVDPGAMLAPGPVTRALLWLPFVVVALTAWLAVEVIRGWSRRTGTGVGRIYVSVLSVAFVALAVALYDWRLLGFHY